MIENLFLSTGAMKAGTTWVYDKLQHNPNIHFSKEKEIYYFSHIDGIANSLSLDKRKQRAKKAIRTSSRALKTGELSLPEHMENIDWYLNYTANEVNDTWYFNLFEEALIKDPTQYIADFSNLTCFLSNEGWSHVRNVAKRIKVIYILRNPIDRLWSHYKFHLQFVNHKEMKSPEENIELFRRITSKPWFYRNSLYSVNIKNMKEFLNEDEFKIYYLDDISSNPESYLKDIEDFIGVDNHDYSNLSLNSKKNTSINKKIPDKWLKEINNLLKEEILELKSMGVWHEKWK